jgi:hypothetical protein
MGRVKENVHESENRTTRKVALAFGRRHHSNTLGLVTQLLHVTQDLVLGDSMARAQTASRYESHLNVLNKQSLTAGNGGLHFTQCYQGWKGS